MPKTMEKKTTPVEKKDIEETRVEEVKTENVKTKKKFEQSDGVICKSVTQGILFVEGTKTKMLYSFSDYGDESEIEYRDLVALVRSKDKSVFEPRFIVNDEDFINEFPTLKKFYDGQFTKRDIKKILNLPDDQMKAEIEKLPEGALNSLKSIAAQQVANGIIDSVRKIRTLDDIFGTDLNLLSSIFSDN